jgi:glycosyltransferase involved in cell wall biosynthesis
MATLGAALIVLNEEAYIERALKNLVSIAREIVVVDGGSTDRTPDICKAYGCKIVRNQFNFDFAAQRNVALAGSSCDWVMTTDADEYFSDEAKAKIIELVRENDEGVGGYRFVRLDRLDGRQIGKTLQWRLLRRLSSTWEGRLHEGVALSSGRRVDLPEEFPLIHCKEMKRQKYNDRLYDNITNGINGFPTGPDYIMTKRTFEG